MAEEVPEININTEETAHVNRQRTQVRRQYEPVGLTANQRARLATRQNAPTTANVEATGDWIGNPTADPNLEGPTAGLIYRGGGPQMGG